MRYPSYMTRQRRAGVTATELDKADKIKQTLMAIAKRRGYGMSYYTDERGRHMARVGRVDGVGMGFVITAQQARAWTTGQNLY